MPDTPTARILIVDDEPINLELFDVMLSNLGFDVEMAADGEEALEKLVSFQPDLMVLDNLMPKLSGWEVTKKIKNEPEFEAFRTVPIIMFSAMDEVKDKIEGLELGVDDYITKPFNFSEVLARIRAVLHRNELSRQLNRRERRIGIIEALNDSLIFFSRHVRQPLTEQVEAAGQLASGGDQAALREFAAAVGKQAAELLGTLDDLEREIGEERDRGEKLKEGELSLDELHTLVHERLTRHGGDPRESGAVGTGGEERVP